MLPRILIERPLTHYNDNPSVMPLHPVPGSPGSKQGPAGAAFVEDIGDLRPDMQERLLRLLDRRAAQRSKSDTRGALRLLVSTGYPLRDRVESGHFSRELVYRLNTIHITLPSPSVVGDEHQ